MNPYLGFWPGQPPFQVLIEGKDGVDFLERLSTAPVSTLGVDQGRDAYFLNATGHFQAAARIWKLAESRLLLEGGVGLTSFLSESSDAWEQNLLEWLDRYHFAEEISITTEEQPCFYLFAEEGGNPPLDDLRDLTKLDHDHSYKRKHQEELDFYFLGQNRWNLKSWMIRGEKDTIEQWLSRLEWREARAEELEKRRIQHLVPTLGHEITSDHNPLEVNLHETLLEPKGCYPGQEVIEKIIAKGQPAQRLVQWQTEEVLSPDILHTLVLDAREHKKAGRISSLALNGHSVGLAVVKRKYAQEGTLLKTESGQDVKITTVAPYAKTP